MGSIAFCNHIYLSCCLLPYDIRHWRKEKQLLNLELISLLILRLQMDFDFHLERVLSQCSNSFPFFVNVPTLHGLIAGCVKEPCLSLEAAASTAELTTSIPPAIEKDTLYDNVGRIKRGWPRAFQGSPPLRWLPWRARVELGCVWGMWFWHLAQ